MRVFSGGEFMINSLHKVVDGARIFSEGHRNDDGQEVEVHLPIRVLPLASGSQT